MNRHATVPDAAERAEFVPFARELAAIACAVIRPFFGSDTPVIDKVDASPVTLADRRAEEVMRALIERRYPDHGVLGEEYGEVRPGARYRWVLDPIDGTRSFVGHCPLFGTLVALARDGRPMIGVIANPITGQVLVGTGDDARLEDGRPARVRGTARIEDATLLTTDPFHAERHRDGAAFDALVRRAKLYRTWGDCQGYAIVATGGADAMLDPILSAWDLMALIPVIEGAGGRITDWAGGDPVGADSIVATNGVLHDAVIAALAGAAR